MGVINMLYNKGILRIFNTIESIKILMACSI